MTSQRIFNTKTNHKQTVAFVQGMLVVLFLLVVAAPASAAGPGGRDLAALLPDAATFYEMVSTDQGDVAVTLLAAAAAEYGNWAPAPGDVATYAPDLARTVRGQVSFVDQAPFECADAARLSRFTEGCDRDFTTVQNLVRLGTSTFADPLDNGGFAPRPSVDDVLSTYVEETGHSWQEYLFETGGQASGARAPTSFEDGLYWSPGWEYQVKMYVLSLDGTWLHLSVAERASFLSALCDRDGYANPVNHHVPGFGAPAGWPNPAGWPTADPSPEAHAAFCAALGASSQGPVW